MTPGDGPDARRFPLGLAAAAAVWSAAVAALLQHTVFRYGSVDLDDLDYRNQAAALRHGMVTLSAATHVPYFVPYLTGVHDGRVVFTHQPLWPAFMAVFEALHLPFAVTVAAQAALFAVAAVALIDEVFDDRVVVIVATVLVVLSPMVMIQSGTLLGYLPTLTLGLATSALALRALRRSSLPTAGVAGLAGGLLVFNRPYDAVLFLVPLVAYAWTVRRGVPLVRLGVAACAGAVVPIAGMLVYNAVVMGAPWRFPYTVHPQDTFGFGSRASFGPSGFNFGPSQAWSGLVHNSRQAATWTVGGGLGLALAVVGVVCHWASRRVRMLSAWVVAFPVAYFFFWTTWNIANFGIIGPLGPLYYLPSLAALAVLTGAGLVRVARWNRVLGALAAVAVVVLAGVTLGSAVSQNVQARNADRAALAVTDSATVQPRLVVTPPAFPDDPYVRLENPPDLGGPVLYAMSPNQQQTLPLLRSRPHQSAFDVASLKPRGGVFKPSVSRLVPLSITTGRPVTFTLTFRPPGAESSFPVSAYAQVDGTKTRRAQFPVTESAGTYRVTWTATPTAVQSGTAVLSLDPNRPAGLRLGFWEGGNGVVGHGSYEYRYAVAPAGSGKLAVLVPGETWRRYVFPGDKVALSHEDLTGILGSDVTGT